jgi:hypothetical protein
MEGVVKADEALEESESEVRVNGVVNADEAPEV